MKTILVRTALLVMTTTPAWADHPSMPANAPPAFETECGGCHLAFPPALLSGSDWKRVMARLDRHYGDNATLDETTRRQIEDFLARNGGSPRQVGTGAGDPPRLTATGWFRREHHEVPAAAWNDQQIGSPANCAACHTRAVAGSFSEHELSLPGGRRHERD